MYAEAKVSERRAVALGDVCWPTEEGWQDPNTVARLAVEQAQHALASDCPCRGAFVAASTDGVQLTTNKAGWPRPLHPPDSCAMQAASMGTPCRRRGPTLTSPSCLSLLVVVLKLGARDSPRQQGSRRLGRFESVSWGKNVGSDFLVVPRRRSAMFGSWRQAARVDCRVLATVPSS